MTIRDQLEERIWNRLADPEEAYPSWDPEDVAEARAEGQPLQRNWVAAMGSEDWEAVAYGTGLHPWHLSQAVLQGWDWEA